MAMSSSCSPPQLQDGAPFLFDCEDLLRQTYEAGSDPGYFSCCSSLSPTSSVDSFCFSPSSIPCGVNGPDPLDCFIFSSPAIEVKQEPQSLPVQGTSARKPRSRYPGKKRQTASEREKLRMRDLTKALHHLRGYLPASVVPAGQTLTKIETLRLTIRYISFLSAQLGLNQDGLSQEEPWAENQTHTQPQTMGQSHSASHFSPLEPSYEAMEAVEEMISYQQSPTTHHLTPLPHSYQISKDVYYSQPPEQASVQASAQACWLLQQQQQSQYTFSGHC